MATRLPDRWYNLRYHAEQHRLWKSDVRFRVVPSGRRSGKTELAKRNIVRAAMAFSAFPDGRFACTAPTHQQAKRIFWDDLKLLTPPGFLARKPSESELSLKLINGASLLVLGLDVPERIEGPPLDGIVIDEAGNMKSDVWSAHVRPALSTPGRPGWAWFIGVPEGQNHYYGLSLHARDPANVDWEEYHWHSEEILDPDEIEAAKKDLDQRTYDQEYGGRFVAYTGRAYYAFDRRIHARQTLTYDPVQPLMFCFDFNVSPGVAVVLQEQRYPERKVHRKALTPGTLFTAVLGEVWIPEASNTPMVCRKLCEDWKHHEGKVLLYGDATGGARGTAKVAGSDWELIQEYLKGTFKNVRMRVSRANPSQKSRINAMNTRLQTADGLVHLLVDPTKAPHVVIDLDMTSIKEGTAGEIDKTKDPDRSHISDALGYYVAEKWPVRTGKQVLVEEWVP